LFGGYLGRFLVDETQVSFWLGQKRLTSDVSLISPAELAGRIAIELELKK
jgi:hypothetical protein